ncbi:MAG TPA: YfhO family protein, partial [Methylomirabilota bacterium]|nr:YfhO family protein [Methylomirabilota bacterium]
ARVSLGAYGAGIAILPFILFVLESYFSQPKTKLVFLLPFAIFALVTSTHPQITFYILTFSLIYLFARIYALRKNLFFFLYPFLFIILGLLLAAIQIIPTAELLFYSNFKTSTSLYIDNFLVPYYHLISFGIPNYFGNAATYNFWGKSDYIETVTSLGLIPCFFVYLTFFFKNKLNNNFIIRKIFIWSSLITTLLAVYSPLSKLLLNLPIPILSTDPPSRIFILTTFFLSILAGEGFEMYLKNNYLLIKKIKISLPFLLTISVIAIATAYLAFAKYTCGKGFIETCHQVALRNTLLEMFIFVLGFVLFLVADFNKRVKHLTAYVIIIVIFAIGFYNAQKYLPFSPKNTVLPQSNLLQTLTRLSKQGRTFGFGDATITTDLATFFKFYDPQYYHPLYIKRYGELTAFANYGKTNNNVLRSDAMIRNDTTLSQVDEFRRERALALLNVRYLIFNKNQKPLKESTNDIVWSDTIRYIKQNTNVLPRVFAVKNITIQKNSNKLLETLFSKQFDPAMTVILEKKPPLTPHKTKLESVIQIKTYQTNNLEIQSKTNIPSILVLLDNDYPGWNAYIDGQKTTVYRADYTFRAIVLPSGNHLVKFVYEPLSARFGLFISAGTLLFIIFFFLYQNYIVPSRSHKESLPSRK